MPRAKPLNPLLPRAIKLTEKHWAAFDARGGVAWLRTLLRTPHSTLADRNAKMAAELAAGVAAKVLAKRYHIAPQTVYNIAQCLKQTSPLGVKPISPTLQPTPSANLQSKWIE